MKNLIPFLILALGASAGAAEYKFDPAHSNIGFTIRHFVSKVSGSFKDSEGTIQFDEAHPEKLAANFTIQAKSINTENAKRDEHLRSPDFFDVEKFSTLTFASKSVKKAGKNKFEMTGDLTIHGVTKPATFQVEYLGKAKDFENKNRAGFTAQTKIKRKDFGINWNKVLDSGSVVLGDEVEINIQAEAIEEAHKS